MNTEELAKIAMTAAQNPVVPEKPEHIAQFFSYEHLKPPLQAVSKLFSDLSLEILKLPRNPERTVAHRKLLESKDAAVRAFIAK